jgi:hypothetical protein
VVGADRREAPARGWGILALLHPGKREACGSVGGHQLPPSERQQACKQGASGREMGVPRSERSVGSQDDCLQQLPEDRGAHSLNRRPVQKRKKPVPEGPAQTMAAPQSVTAFRVQALERRRGERHGVCFNT